jgi:hypothetical protein
MAMFESNDPDAAKKMRQMFGPGQVDEMIRHAIHISWAMLPEDRQTVDELEKQMRRIMDRAIKDLREDADQFGLGK